MDCDSEYILLILSSFTMLHVDDDRHLDADKILQNPRLFLEISFSDKNPAHGFLEMAQ